MMTLHWVHPHTSHTPFSLMAFKMVICCSSTIASACFFRKWRLGQNSRPSSSFQKKIGSRTKMYIMDIHRLYLIFVFFLGGVTFAITIAINLKDNYCVCNSRCPIFLSHLHAASSVHFRDAKTNI